MKRILSVAILVLFSVLVLAACRSSEEKETSIVYRYIDSGGRDVTSEIVYWVPNGEVYHKSENCSYIRGKSYIKYGTVNDAKNAGKSRPCSRCGK